jgi:hypothetical protein
MREVRPLTPAIAEGQCVKVIGLGGVGSVVARYAAVFLGSLGRDVRLVFIDGDAFEVTNAARMCFATYGNKAEVMAEELASTTLEETMTPEAIVAYVDEGNVAQLVRSGDIVLLCVDNHATRRLVGEHVATLERVCLISAGNDGVGPDASGVERRGTYGNCQVHVRDGGVDVTPPITRFHPEIASPKDRPPTDPSCTEAIASTPQILCANVTAAACVLNALWLHLSGALHYGEVAFDVADALMRPLPLGRA